MITPISLILTLLIFSYLLGDNFLFRLAVSAFVGLAAAFTTVVTLQSVILPLINIGNGENLALLLVSAVLTLLLLVKPIRSLRVFANISLGFLIAVGAAISVIGAISGTIIPIVTQTASIQSDASIGVLINGVLIIIGVVSSVLYFGYGARKNVQGEPVRNPLMRVVALVGQGFIVITLGALYGAAILTSLTILTGQLEMLFGA